MKILLIKLALELLLIAAGIDTPPEAGLLIQILSFQGLEQL